MVTGIDTLRLYERFIAADINDKAAKEIAEALKEVEQARLDDLATKRDLKELELSMEAKLAEIRADLIKWMVGLLIAQAGVIVALVKLI